MSSTRASLHRLIDTLPDHRLEMARALLLELTVADEDIVIPWEAVREALGTPRPATEGLGALDALFADDPELKRQFEESLQEIKDGRPLIAHEAIKRMINSATDG